MTLSDSLWWTVFNKMYKVVSQILNKPEIYPALWSNTCSTPLVLENINNGVCTGKPVETVMASWLLTCVISWTGTTVNRRWTLASLLVDTKIQWLKDSRVLYLNILCFHKLSQTCSSSEESLGLPVQGGHLLTWFTACCLFLLQPMWETKRRGPFFCAKDKRDSCTCLDLFHATK